MLCKWAVHLQKEFLKKQKARTDMVFQSVLAFLEYYDSLSLVGHGLYIFESFGNRRK